MPEEPQDLVRISVRVPPDHVAVLEQAAEREDRTTSAEVRRLIRRHVEAFRENLGGSIARTP